MIAPRFELVVVALLAVVVARGHPALRPARNALLALAAIDCARLLTYPHAAEWPWGRLHALLGLAWPGVAAALSWRVWRSRWLPVAAGFLAYAVALVLAPRGWWPAHPQLWADALRLPHVAAPLLSVVACALKDEGPGGHPSSPSACDDCASLDGAQSVRSPAEEPTTSTSPDRAAQAARRVAAILAWSGLLDVTIGALAPAGRWELAGPLAWATWAAVGLVLVGARRG